MKKIIALFSVLLFTVISCDQKPAIRQYTETTVFPDAGTTSMNDPHAGLNLDIGKPKTSMAEAMKDPNINQMIQQSAAKAPIQWKTPEGWVEKPASGLRMATFASNDSNPIECSITALGGGAGGLEPNITRWAGQIKMEISAETLTEFIDKRTPIETQSGLKGSFLDFTILQSKGDDQPSILAAVFEIEGTSIFIKMNGTQKTIESNRPQFMQLIASLTH